MVAICSECHKLVEFTKKGQKRSLVAAQFAYAKLVRRKNQQPNRKKHKCIKRPSKPQCACGNLRRKNRVMCGACDPSKTRIT